MADNIHVSTGGRVYTWFGGSGAQLESNERRVKQGELRVIEGEVCYAFSVRRGVVAWGLTGSVDAARVMAFKAKLFGLERPNAH